MSMGKNVCERLLIPESFFFHGKFYVFILKFNKVMDGLGQDCRKSTGLIHSVQFGLSKYGWPNKLLQAKLLSVVGVGYNGV